MKSFQISFDVEPIGGVAPLDLEVVVDGLVLWKHSVQSAQSVSVDCDDGTQKSTRVLQFRMQGKTAEHTAMFQGQIIGDACLNISQISFNHILIQRYFENNNRYFHDCNGNSDPVCEQFYGVMGCNGIVEMTFQSPVTLWLLENL